MYHSKATITLDTIGSPAYIDPINNQLQPGASGDVRRDRRDKQQQQYFVLQYMVQVLNNITIQNVFFMAPKENDPLGLNLGF